MTDALIRRAEHADLAAIVQLRREWTQEEHGDIADPDFEEHLARHRIIVVKFWLQISKAEQLRRFRARQHTPFKRFKITPEDWRNRKKRKAYTEALDADPLSPAALIGSHSMSEPIAATSCSMRCRVEAMVSAGNL